jgi:hypothetical protein
MLMSIRTNHFISSKISSIKGVVSNLSNEVLEYVNHEKPTHDHSSVYYKRFYVSKFNLGNHAVEATFSSPMKIQDGNIVAVAGQQKDKVFKVLAYENQTQNITHHESWIALILGAIFFFAIAIGLLNSDLSLNEAIIPRLFLFGFSLVGIYMGYRALLIREAIKLIGTK